MCDCRSFRLRYKAQICRVNQSRQFPALQGKPPAGEWVDNAAAFARGFLPHTENQPQEKKQKTHTHLRCIVPAQAVKRRTFWFETAGGLWSRESRKQEGIRNVNCAKCSFPHSDNEMRADVGAMATVVFDAEIVAVQLLVLIRICSIYASINIRHVEILWHTPPPRTSVDALLTWRRAQVTVWSGFAGWVNVMWMWFPFRAGGRTRELCWEAQREAAVRAGEVTALVRDARTHKHTHSPSPMAGVQHVVSPLSLTWR